jgi:hypothetical protein
MTEILLRAGQPWGAHRHHGRRYPSYSRELGGGLFANVVNGVVTSVGVEPVGDWVVRRSGRVEALVPAARPSRPTLVWAAPLATAAIGGAAFAASFALRHGRRAA